jgi:hypothetical protein
MEETVTDAVEEDAEATEVEEATVEDEEDMKEEEEVDEEATKEEDLEDLTATVSKLKLIRNDRRNPNLILSFHVIVVPRPRVCVDLHWWPY